MPMNANARSLGLAIDAHDNGFNLVRLCAAMLVLVFHAWQLNPVAPGRDPISAELLPITDLGALAVAIFFMVSGIFISQSWMRDPHALRFALRRVARIVPGLFVCLTVCTVTAVIFFSDDGWRGLLGPAPWRYIFGNTVLHWLQLNISPTELRLPGVLANEAMNGPLWTLYWEGRMYVMVALIGMAAILPMRRWMTGAALFLLLATNIFPSVVGGYVWEVRLWSMFLIGMLLQAAAPQVRVRALSVACAAVLLWLNWSANLILTPSGYSWFGLTLTAGALALLVGSARPARLGLGHLQRHDYSYGVYIYHWPVIVMLRAALPPLGPLPLLGVALLVTLAVAALSWHLVEAPALRLTRRLLARHSARAERAPLADQPA
ncbi:MAG: acyltransferase [Pseudomonadota bacterium]